MREVAVPLRFFLCKICIKYSFIIAPLVQHGQTFPPAKHLCDKMFDKEAVFSEPEKM